MTEIIVGIVAGAIILGACIYLLVEYLKKKDTKIELEEPLKEETEVEEPKVLESKPEVKQIKSKKTKKA